MFTKYGCGGNLDMNWTMFASYCFPMPRKTCLKFELNWLSGYREDPDVLCALLIRSCNYSVASVVRPFQKSE